jgi:hypothetical protein
MSPFSEIQPIEQQPQAKQLLYCQPAEGKPEQLVCTTEAALASPLEQLDTVTLVKTGGIPAAIILCIAVLILALAEYNKSFLLRRLPNTNVKDSIPIPHKGLCQKKN